MKNLSVLIPARAGSERVKDKNLRAFAGSSLLRIKISQMKRLGLMVYVSTECKYIARIARKEGASIIWRDPVFADSSTSMREVYRHIARNFPDKIMLYANCTNPLIGDAEVATAIAHYQRIIPDSLNTCHRVNQFLWQDGQPLNYDAWKQPRSQDIRTVALNFAVNIVDRDYLADTGMLVSGDPYLFEIHHESGFDIDTQSDFEYAESLYKKYHAIQ